MRFKRYDFTDAKRYDFPPMLGPHTDYPEGSPDWALRLGNLLDYTTASCVRYAVDDLLRAIRTFINAEVPPWTVWPDPPCGSANAFFELSTGYSYDQLLVLIDTFHPDHGLPRV